MRRWFVLVAVLMVGVSSFAELKLAAVFSDNMVVQRGQKVPVWGWADAGEIVTVRFSDQDKTTKAGEDGKFIVKFAKMVANKAAQELVVETGGGEKLVVKNILIGEVWLCSGQSNMQFPVSKAANFDKEKVAANHPLIRMFLTDLKASTERQADCTGVWNVCTPENVGKFSAAAYFFGRELQQKLDVPIGLIRSAWGGTRIEAWIPMETLETFPTVMAGKALDDEQAAKFDAAVAEQQYAKQLEVWKQQAKQAKANGQTPPRRPKKTVHPHASQQYTANLYNAMIHPLVPYAIRGAIWYQGESNTGSFGQAMLYRDLLESLATSWSKAWGNKSLFGTKNFPFYSVQLPNFKAPQTQPSEDTTWAFIRESFMDVHQDVPNAGMAITIDVGMADNIHPTNKQAVGYRLAQQALARTYKMGNVAGGPVYKSMKKDGSTIVVKFEDIGSGLVAKDGALKTFAIAGEDKQFVWADAVIEGDTVVVSSSKVAEPVSVRYAWADNPVGCNLFNKEGFPASPFRTDDWAPVENK
ncbi:MAG: sialate O-acetylesterase [Kiritimatiellales bacterium]|nr:sialate O-acetylesterase [Kiritimatiellales bacterium]